MSATRGSDSWRSHRSCVDSGGARTLSPDAIRALDTCELLEPGNEEGHDQFVELSPAGAG
jgi:hypothetical protein